MCGATIILPETIRQMVTTILKADLGLPMRLQLTLLLKPSVATLYFRGREKAELGYPI
jgi:hypothetical protein